MGPRRARGTAEIVAMVQLEIGTPCAVTADTNETAVAEWSELGNVRGPRTHARETCTNFASPVAPLPLRRA